MNNPISSKQYVINNLDFNAGDIVSGSIPAVINNFGAININYQKVGKLYFNIWASTIGGLQIFFTNDATTYNEVASLMGLTVNTPYTLQNYGCYTGNYSGSVTWNANPPGNSTRNILGAFLAN